MIDKTQTGVSFFDERYGGTYRHRPLLVTGRSGTGKTVFSLQFVMQGIQLDERCLLLSAWRANDLVIYAESLGFPLAQAIEAGRLILLEYSQYVPGRDKEWNIVLPPEGFLQLEEMIRSQAVQRVVLDTVLAWVCIREHQRLDEHLFSFVRAFDRMQVTTVFTLPKPVSPLAYRVKNTMENLVPVAITLSREPNTPEPLFIVSKYLGESRLTTGLPYRIVPKVGIRVFRPGETLPAVEDVPHIAPAPAAPTPTTPPTEELSKAATPPPSKLIRFSTIMPGLDRITPVPERRRMSRPF